MERIRQALEAQRKVEQDFVDEARQTETAPKGWPAALVMFHISTWRELLRNAMAEVAEGRPFTPPPENIDEFNDTQLPSGIGTPLNDAAARADHLMQEVIGLYDRLGERPFEWYIAKDTTVAVLRNSYTHPRQHLTVYLRENGNADRANQIWEDARSDMGAAAAPPLVMGAVLYNLAVTRVALNRLEEALDLLKESFPMRPDLKESATADADLAALRDDERFQTLIKG